MDTVTFPAETDAPLIVDTNTMLPVPATLESLQPIPRRHIQLIQRGDRIDLDQLAYRDASKEIPAAALSGLEECPDILVCEASDQLSIV